MDWFRAHHGITSDRKWPIIAKISGQKIGDVVAVWIALLEHASQSDDRGHILGFDTETIDVLYGYEDGTTESIVNALKKKGMIFDDWITNWGKRQPDRERDDDSAERVKRFRERQKQQIQSNQCNTETTQSCNANVTLHVTDVTDVTPCNAQIRTEQIRTEQNREENIETSNEVSCVEPAKSAVSTPPASRNPDFEISEEKKPPPEVFCVMPCNGKKQEYPVTQQYVAEMSGLYPGIDIERETFNALAWLKNNPTRRKTHNGMTRFLGNWYNRAQNNLQTRASPMIRAPAQSRDKPLWIHEQLAKAKAEAEKEVANV